MKRLLLELEARLRTLPPPQRAQLADAVKQLVRAVGAGGSAFRGLFQPSKGAALLMLSELVSAATGGTNLVVKAKKLAPTIGPHVAALVQAL